MTPNITKLGTIASDSAAALLNRERAAIAKEFFIYKRLFLKLMFTLEKAVQCRSAASSVPMCHFNLPIYSRADNFLFLTWGKFTRSLISILVKSNNPLVHLS